MRNDKVSETPEFNIHNMRNYFNYLFDFLNIRNNRITRLMGYSLLPKGPEARVFNVPESDKYKTPNGDSCIGYWERNIGFQIEKNTIYHCPACSRKMSKGDSTLDGAHVYKQENPLEWYFVPLCTTCNKPENRNLMKIRIPLVPVPQECYEKK